MAENYNTDFMEEEAPETQSEKELVSFVVDHCDRWRDWRDSNYETKWDEYERIYYGIWSAEDRTRDSERSKIISPATRQAVDNRVAETMEGFAGSGKLFEISDDGLDQDSADIEVMQALLLEDTHNNAYINNVSSIVKLAEIYGTGVGEVLVKTELERVPTTQEMPEQGMAEVGVTEREKVSVKIKPINPKNLLIDPNADSVDDSMGIGVEEYISYHQILRGIASGVYKNVDIDTQYDNDDLESSEIESTTYQDDKVKIIRYYGLVPRDLLEASGEVEQKAEELFPDDEEKSSLADMVEAIVVIANDGQLLKAERSPYMMEDRPIIIYRPEVRPGRFYGVGTVEKGYNMQKAIDAQLRSHMDSLALTTAPMMGIDATRLPRGMKFEIRPGKNILTNGNPAEILQPFKFGSTDASNYDTAKGFEAMLLQATGTLDSSELVKSAAGGGQNNGMGMSLAMSAIVKKNRVAMASFQDDFIIPMVKKVAYRYMQFDPERYPMKDFKFTTMSSIGAIAREHEQQQLIGLLQTLGPSSPIVPVILKSIVSTSGLLNREQLVAQLDQMSQPNPQAQEMQMQTQQAQMQYLAAQTAELQARAQESMADAQEAQANAQKIMIEASLMEDKVKTDMIRNLSANIKDEDTEEFTKRAKIADLLIKEKDIESKERIVDKQMQEKRMTQ
ncbi:MAG: hypothetical protein CMJ25_07785 [Phycisphaerae bacterium]|nr:hypothetical protein [Phycisphaerae bacterium]|tara:strand:+ start:832 stop:2856 length:2025 start_codon:yes stop_codon:yes gene_type:complete